MKNNIKTLIGASVAALAVASTAVAVPLGDSAIRYSTDGVTWSTVILDNGSGDSDPTGNFIATLIIAPGLTLHVNAAASSSGTAASPNIDIGLQGQIGLGESLYIEYSDKNFTPVPSGAFHMTYSVNDTGTVGATAYTAFGSGANANDLFDGADFSDLGTLTGIGPLTGHSSGESFAPPGTDAPYSLTIVQVITGGRSGGQISTDSRITVPDGGNTLMLLGSALSVLGFGAFRKSRKA